MLTAMEGITSPFQAIYLLASATTGISEKSLSCFHYHKLVILFTTYISRVYNYMQVCGYTACHEAP